MICSSRGAASDFTLCEHPELTFPRSINKDEVLAICAKTYLMLISFMCRNIAQGKFPEGQ